MRINKSFISTCKESFETIDENYPVVMQNWLIIIMAMLWTVIIIVVSTIWYFEYCKATDKKGLIVTQLRGNSKTPSPAVNQLYTLNRKGIVISSPKLISILP